jgi:hypothetical protein
VARDQAASAFSDCTKGGAAEAEATPEQKAHLKAWLRQE